MEDIRKQLAALQTTLQDQQAKIENLKKNSGKKYIIIARRKPKNIESWPDEAAPKLYVPAQCGNMKNEALLPFRFLRAQRGSSDSGGVLAWGPAHGRGAGPASVLCVKGRGTHYI